MDNLRSMRVKQQSRAALGMLKRSAQEAEALPDQALAEDLWELAFKLERILNAAERKRYVKQS